MSNSCFHSVTGYVCWVEEGLRVLLQFSVGWSRRTWEPALGKNLKNVKKRTMDTKRDVVRGAGVEVRMYQKPLRKDKKLDGVSKV